MASERQANELARRAAMLLHEGHVRSLREAIEVAAARAATGVRDIPLRLVREHVRGMALQVLGSVRYRESVSRTLERAEELMTLLAHASGAAHDEAPVALVGRAARGDVDADPCCRIRVETDVPIERLAELAVEAGYAEPEFRTIESRFGRLSTLRIDDDGVELRVVRCPTAIRAPMDRDVVHGKPIASLSLVQLRRLLEGLRADHADG